MARCPGQVVLGVGYAAPYLRPFREEAERTIALMPASQGVVYWPPEGPGLSALADEAELPLPDMSVDRVLLVHGLECTEQLRHDAGDLARHGGRRPPAGGGAESPGHLGADRPHAVRPWQSVFPLSVEAHAAGKHVRPGAVGPRTVHPAGPVALPAGSAPAWEEIGERWFKAFAGVYLVEASKQIYAGVARKALVRPKKRRLIMPLPSGAGMPGAAGAAHVEHDDEAPVAACDQTDLGTAAALVEREVSLRTVAGWRARSAPLPDRSFLPAHPSLVGWNPAHRYFLDR